MPEYRRAYIPGGTYFITMVTYDRVPIFANPVARGYLRDAWDDVANRFPFTTDAICLLPDHIHTVITLPENDSDYSVRIREIKRLFTKSHLSRFGNGKARNLSHQKKNEASIWQRRFWEHYIQDEKDLHAHLDYVHFNPVKHGLVKRVSDWKWSSFHRYVKMGFYEEDWGEGVENLKVGGNFGE